MSAWSDVKREMRPAELMDREFKALRVSLESALRMIPSGDRVEMPGVSKAGKPYLLRIDVAGGKIHRFEVDHDPDLSPPIFDALTDFVVKCKAEDQAAQLKGGGDCG